MNTTFLEHCVFNEKFLENLVRDNPFLFFKEQLSLDQQQPFIRGYRPDLIFKDAESNSLIVEVQNESLDRNHLYRCIEYRDSLLDKKYAEKVRVALVSTALEDRFRPLLEAHQIEIVVVPSKDVWTIAIETIPNFDVAKSPHIRLNPFSALKQLSESPLAVCQKHNETFAIWHSVSDRLLGMASTFLTPPAIKTTPLAGRKSNAEVYSPVQLLISSGNVRCFEKTQIEPMGVWCEIIRETPYWDHPAYKSITLGVRGWGIRGWNTIYEDHVHGQIKKFEVLWSRYRSEGRYDVESIKNDLAILEQLTFYCGEYPDLYPVRFAKGIELIPGGTPLCEEAVFRRAGRTDPALVREYLSSGAFQDDRQWITIRILGLCPQFEALFPIFWNHVSRLYDERLAQTNRRSKRRQQRFGSDSLHMEKCRHCLIEPRTLDSISPDLLRLSSKALFHPKANV
jgi:hypothetical protein